MVLGNCLQKKKLGVPKKKYQVFDNEIDDCTDLN